ncbi:MAG: ATP-binding protein [Puia sp.]|nr:ATP-binding protein [Puia sp.]
MALLEKNKNEFEERTIKAINRDNHDFIGNRIVHALSHLYAIDFEEGDDRGKSLEIALAKLDEAMQSIREGVDYTGTYILKNEGLEKAIRSLLLEFESNGKYKTSFQVTGDVYYPYDAELEKELFRILQEATRNILQHAGARSITIILEFRENGNTSLSIRDDGIGIDPVIMQSLKRGRHTGLENMETRARLLGGRLLVENLKPTGTLVKAEIPKSTKSL